MTVGIFSDTHDNLKNITRAVDIFRERKVEALIHAGDFCSPFVFNVIEKIRPVCSKMYAVFGNNDGDKLLLTQKAGSFCIVKDILHEVELEGRNIAIMHYPALAERFFREGSFDLVIYGHNHQPLLQGTDRLLLNPGTCSGYLAERATISVIDLGSMKAEIIPL
jgi:putative phosphoesterase